MNTNLKLNLTMKAAWGIVSVLLAGCVGTGRLRPTVVTEYQERLVRQGPPKVIDDGELGLLQPVEPSKAGRELKIESVTGADGKPRSVVHLKLDDAVRLALANNPQIHVSAYNPSISHQEMIKAAAEFDYVMFATWSTQKTDINDNSSVPNGLLKETAYSAGVKEKTITGAEWQLAATMTRSWSPYYYRSYSTAYEPKLSLSITQPLLKNAGPEYNLAQLRLARVSHSAALSQFRQKVESIVSQVISAYWTLVQARQNYQIVESLLAKTADTQQKVMARVQEGLASTLQGDQMQSTYASRQASLISARKAVGDAQDALVRLLNDARLNLSMDVDVVTADSLADAKVIQDIGDQLATALRYNPSLEQARLGIAAQFINVRIAANQALPRLDLSTSTEMQGLADRPHEALQNFATKKYVGYTLSLVFEQPVGNRAAEADLLKAKLSHSQAMANLQDAADQVSELVRQQVRQVNAAYEEVVVYTQAVAAGIGYRDRLEVTVSQELGMAMTPERLQLLLSAQELVASLEQTRLASVAAYNQALVQLAQAKGTVLDLPNLRVTLPEAAGVEAMLDEMPVGPTSLPSPTTQPK